MSSTFRFSCSSDSCEIIAQILYTLIPTKITSSSQTNLRQFSWLNLELLSFHYLRFQFHGYLDHQSAKTFSVRYFSIQHCWPPIVAGRTVAILISLDLWMHIAYLNDQIVSILIKGRMDAKAISILHIIQHKKTEYFWGFIFRGFACLSVHQEVLGEFILFGFFLLQWVKLHSEAKMQIEKAS